MLASESQSEGDTQPISQSVYEKYHQWSKEQREAGASRVNENALEIQHSEPHTLQQGEPGHINLLAAFEQSTPDIGSVPPEDAPLDDDVEPLSQPPEIRADIFPESGRFQAPKTPASQGRKRKREAESSPKRASTPRLPLNPFAGQAGSMDGLMSASQLFQATQAATSPLANAAASDGLSERPSPDMYNPQRPSTAGSLSSPVRLPRANMTRAATEPQTVYISMKESQEQREKLIQDRKAKQALLRDEDSDDDFNDDPALRRRLRKRRYDLEAREQFAKVAAMSEAATDERSRGVPIMNTSVKLSSPRLGRQAHEPVIISDDASTEDRGDSITEDETEREDDLESQEEEDIDELAEDNKENVEVPGTVLRGQVKRSQVISSQPTPSHRPGARSNVSSPSKRLVQVLGSSQTSKPRDVITPAEAGTQPDAIADSQSSQTHLRVKHHGGMPEVRALSEPRSSLDSRILVPQSQSSEGSKTLHPPITGDGKQTNLRTLQSSSPDTRFTEDELRSAVSGERAQNQTASTNSTKVRTLPENTFQAPKQLTQTNTAPNHDNTEGINSSEGVVPDSSNLTPSSKTTLKVVSKVASSHSITDESHASTFFHTAPEQTVKPSSNLSPQRGQKRSQSAQPSPEKSRRFRSMSEIAADPSPPDAIGEVDIGVEILSSEDREFNQTIRGSSPIAQSRKRLKTGHFLVSQAAKRAPIVLPPFPGSPIPPSSSAISKITPVKSSSTKSTVASSPPPSSGVSPVTAKQNRDNMKQHGLQPITEIEAPQEADVMNGVVSEPVLQNQIAPNIPDAGVSGNEDIRPDQPQNDGRADIVQTAVTGGSPIIAPNRVFAHFNGIIAAYHPATCLGVIGGEDPRYSVRFDDGTVDTISAYGIKRLELKIGDMIKVDLPGTRTKNYIVNGMRDQRRPATLPDPNTPSRRGRSHSTNDAAFPETDIHGFATVLASPKQRISMDGNQSDSSQIAIPLTHIYFTQTMWTSFKNRQYTYVPNPGQIYTGLQTPSERPSTPSTPSSRTRRMRMSGLNLSGSATTDARQSEGMFGNMAFAITNVDRDQDNKRVKDLINSNGGLILENGFEDLFSIPALNRATNSAGNTAASFHLTSQSKDIGFTCLIADKHCRRAKFIQALALGIPCLATRWISDCVTKQRVLPWGPYLLPSGESSFLGGAVRSRNLQPFQAATGKLNQMVEIRPKLLEDASVLLIMDKSQEETMRQHPLITHALGASKVARAISVDEAVKNVGDAQALGQPWDWVFSYDKEKEVEKRLSGAASNGKKRKRGRETEGDVPQIKKAKTKVVGNEFVIQSLILGMLIDN